MLERQRKEAFRLNTILRTERLPIKCTFMHVSQGDLSTKSLKVKEEHVDLGKGEKAKALSSEPGLI